MASPGGPLAWKPTERDAVSFVESVPEAFYVLAGHGDALEHLTPGAAASSAERLVAVDQPLSPLRLGTQRARGRTAVTDGAERSGGRRGTGSPPGAQHRLNITVYGEDVDVLDAVAVTSGQVPKEAAAALVVAAALAACRRTRRRRLEVVAPDSLDAGPRDHSATRP